MAVLITHAQQALDMDTLPVIKLTEWYGVPGRDTVYAYARMYFCGGGLRLCMTVFDGHPPATQTAHAVLGLGARTLELAFTAASAGYALWEGETPPADPFFSPLPAGCCLFGAGEDEQGWYWQVTCHLKADFLAGCGLTVPADGQSFCGGFFLQDRLEAAFGSAFAAPSPAASDPRACLGELTVAAY